MYCSEIFGVLLVEDSKADVVIFEDVIRNFNKNKAGNILIGICSSLQEAEKILEKKQYDLILLDLNLPDAQELTGLKRLIEKYPDTPIVIHSGLYSPHLAREAISIGAQDYIVKGTMDEEDLIRTMFHAKLRHDTIRKLKAICNFQ